jgi:REP element-mobilizing transposase RayT
VRLPENLIMPRYRRLHAPGALVHIIGRFVNREFRVQCQRERAEYLRRIPAALERCDWTMLGYVVMSSHVHLLMLAGEAPSARFVQPLHVGFSGWLNKRQGTLGPLFAERHTTILCEPARAARLLSYLHNNPVRAGVVRDAEGSTWSSHRAYAGETRAPSWLDVEAGLSLSGFNSSPRGRTAFDAFVRGERHVTAEDMRGQGLTALRADVRRSVGAPVEISSADDSAGERRVEVLAQPGMRLRPRWPGQADVVIAAVATRLQVPAELICSRDRRRRIVKARRLALRAWTMYLGRHQVSMCSALNISQQAGSLLLAKNEMSDLARAIADDLLQGKSIS